MIASLESTVPAELARELESRFFWWEPVGSQPRSAARILAQAMNFAPFDIVLRLERELGPDRLADAMLDAAPGWLSDRSWEFWRGRLALATGRAIPEEPPRRSFDSLDFDFFRSETLDKQALQAFAFMRDAKIIQEDENTIVAIAPMAAGPVKVSFFGGMSIGRINDPLLTVDSILLVASIDDLLATKLKAILDRAEAKDYQDIAAILRAGTSLEKALGAFKKIWNKDPALPLKALGFFKDGDLPSLPKADREILRAARDRVKGIPDVALKYGTLGGTR